MKNCNRYARSLTLSCYRPVATRDRGSRCHDGIKHLFSSSTRFYVLSEINKIKHSSMRASQMQAAERLPRLLAAHFYTAALIQEMVVYTGKIPSCIFFRWAKIHHFSMGYTSPNLGCCIRRESNFCCAVFLSQQQNYAAHTQL